MIKVFRMLLMFLCMSFFTFSTAAVAIPIYDIGDTIPGYGIVTGMSIVDLVNNIVLEDGDLSPPLYLYSETAVENHILVKDLIVSYSFSKSGVPEPQTILLFGAGILGLVFARRKLKLG